MKPGRFPVRRRGRSGVTMKNLWKYSGWFLVAIGVIHNGVGLAMGYEIAVDMVRSGLLNTVVLQYDRNFLFWFLTTGCFWMLMGIHWQMLLRDGPLPPLLGWATLLYAIAGAAISPTSGIWLFFPLAWMLLYPHFQSRSF